MELTRETRPFFELRGVKLRLWPIILAALVMQSIIWAGQGVAKAVYRSGSVWWDGHVAVYLLLAIFFQAVVGLVAIAIMARFLPQADAHLRWPTGKNYVGHACLLGILMGIVMLVADYWPDLLSQSPPQTNYQGSPLDLVGFQVGMLTTGLAEETIFRGLLVGMLAVLVPGRLRIAGIDLPVAAYLVSLLFALAHWHSFVTNPLHTAIAQQCYAFAWGLLYVWLMERSNSLLAPIVAHGVSNFVEVGLILILISIWS